MKNKITYWEMPVMAKPINVDALIQNVCDHFGINIHNIADKTRKREYVEARGIISYHLRRRTNKSFMDIGELFNKDHASIMHYIKRTENLMDVDSKYKELVKSF